MKSVLEKKMNIEIDLPSRSNISLNHIMNAISALYNYGGYERTADELKDDFTDGKNIAGRILSYCVYLNLMSRSKKERGGKMLYSQTETGKEIGKLIYAEGEDAARECLAHHIADHDIFKYIREKVQPTGILKVKALNVNFIDIKPGWKIDSTLPRTKALLQILADLQLIKYDEDTVELINKNEEPEKFNEDAEKLIAFREDEDQVPIGRKSPLFVRKLNRKIESSNLAVYEDEDVFLRIKKEKLALDKVRKFLEVVELELSMTNEN